MTIRDCPLPPGARVVAYFRDSGGIGQERSVGQQRRVADAYCAGVHIVLTRVFADEARVGSTIVGRDQFEEMISYLRRLAPEDRRKRSPEAPDGVLLWDLKRFARNQLDGQYFKADLRRRGYTIIFLSDNIPDGDLGIVYESMLEWKGQQDLVEISKDVKRGLKDTVSMRGPDGRLLGLCPGRPPTGFKGEPYRLESTRRDGKPHMVQRWVVDPDVWPRARRAWEMRLAGMSYTEIHAETRLFRTVNCYATFFRNRIYTGTLVYSGIEYEDFVPAMVTPEEFDAVQRMRKPKHQHRPRHDSSDYPLSGMIYCGLCGRPMKGDSVPARSDAGDGYARKRYRRYACTGWKYRRDCELHHLRAEMVESAVFDLLREQVLTRDRMLAMLSEQQLDERKEELASECRQLTGDITKLDRVISRLIDEIEETGSHAVRDRLATREAERAALQVRLSDVQREIDAANHPVPVEVIERFCENGQAVLESGSPDDVRDLLRTFVIRIEVEPGGGRLIYSFPLVGL